MATSAPANTRTRRFEDVPLTPRHSLTVLGGMEDDEVGRFVVGLFYSWRQRLEANPFGDDGVPFATIGLLFEKVFGKLRVFVNVADLNNVRQTQYDPLVRPTQGPDGRLTVDAWAPPDGRNINGGIRVTATVIFLSSSRKSIRRRHRPPRPRPRPSCHQPAHRCPRRRPLRHR